MSKPFPLCYETFGNPQDPCIMLIMGIGGQLIQWPDSFTQGLAAQGYYVITFDNRDSGLSQYYSNLHTLDLQDVIAAKQQGKPFHPPYTLEDMAADVIALMDHCHVKQAHIVGISMGGFIAQLVAIHYPDRVLSLTCIATTSGDPQLPPSKPEVLAFFFSSQPQAATQEAYVNKKVELYRIYTHPDFFDEEKVRAFVVKIYNRAHDDSGFKRQLLAVIGAEPRIEKLKSLQMPTLIIHGDDDPVFPVAHGKHLHECIANSRLEIIEKMGHGIPDMLCEKLVLLCSAFYRKGGSDGSA